MTDPVAQDMIRSFVDRILRLKEEAKSINGDIREVYAEAKGNGFDKTVLGKLVSYIEKRATDSAAQMEVEALFDLYLSAYDGASHTHAYARDWGEITDSEHVEVDSLQPSERRFRINPEKANGGDHEKHGIAKIPNSSTGADKPDGLSAAVNCNDDMADGAGSIAGGGSDVSASDVEVVAPSDHSKPNPICRDPDECGVYASWAMPCQACKAAAQARAA